MPLLGWYFLASFIGTPALLIAAGRWRNHLNSTPLFLPDNSRKARKPGENVRGVSA